MGLSSLSTDVCDSQASNQIIWSRWNRSVINWKEIVSNHEWLRSKFEHCHSTQAFSKEAKSCFDEVHEFILSKKNHSRVGFEFKKYSWKMH